MNLSQLKKERKRVRQAWNEQVAARQRLANKKRALEVMLERHEQVRVDFFLGTLKRLGKFYCGESSHVVSDRTRLLLVDEQEEGYSGELRRRQYLVRVCEGCRHAVFSQCHGSEAQWQAYRHAYDVEEQAGGYKVRRGGSFEELPKDTEPERLPYIDAELEKRFKIPSEIKLQHEVRGDSVHIQAGARRFTDSITEAI